MSKLAEKIESDFLSAFKAKNAPLTSVLRLLKSALKNAEIDKKSPLIDDDIFKILKREIKQRLDSAEQYEKGGRSDLASKELNEIDLLNSYLPAQMSDSEIESIIKETIKEVGASSKKDFGRVMGVIMPKFSGLADGSKVSKILNSQLLDD